MADKKFGELSIQVILQIDSTNGSTFTNAVEAILGLQKRYKLPETGEELDADYWRVKVLQGWRD